MRNFNRCLFAGLLLGLMLSNPPAVQQLNAEEKIVSERRFDHGAYSRDANLQAVADALLPLFDNMPPVPVNLKDEPINKAGTSVERRVAYTFCDGGEFPVTFMKRDFYEKTNRLQLVNILKHELTHAFLCRRGQMSGHDENFRRKFKEIGGTGN